MAEMMRGVCLDENQDLTLKKFNVPEPKRGYVRVKVKRSGICATDLGYWKHGSDRLGELPVILGHEGCGVVDKLGEDAKGVEVGDRVVVMTTYHVCGTCKYCREGRTNMCVERLGIGSKKNGLFAEYVEVPASSCIKMPDNMSFEEGALVEVTACCVHALYEETFVNADEVVVVSGPGAIGTLAALCAKAAGATVVLTGIAQDVPRLKVAKELGIDYCVNQMEEDLTALVMDLTDGQGADMTVECAGVGPSFNVCYNLLRKHGRLCLMGVHHAPVTIDLYPIHAKELSIIGSLSQKPTAWHSAIKMIADGKLNVKPLVSDVVSLEDYLSGFEKAAHVTGFKVLFDPEK